MRDSFMIRQSVANDLTSSRIRWWFDVLSEYTVIAVTEESNLDGSKLFRCGSRRATHDCESIAHYGLFVALHKVAGPGSGGELNVGVRLTRARH
jgi:hypothetical protein